jgi:spore maturation protein CgeB
MKAFVVSPGWAGGLFKYITKALADNAFEVESTCFSATKRPLIKATKLHNIVQVRAHFLKKDLDVFNAEVLRKINEFKPEYFISFNEAFLFPQTHEVIQAKGIRVIKFIADNPFDSFRFSFLPISLKYCDLILVHDKIWIPSIRRVAPNASVEKITCGGGVDKDIFYPILAEEINHKDRAKLACDVAFTGESYNMRGEAGYRSDILDFLGDYDVRIWGDQGWQKRFPYYKNLERFYKGGRLPFDELLKLYSLATINLNMPSPQIFTGFQPRTFEIAAARGFQIADWREELDEVFSEDELVTFKTIPELIDKVDYFKRNQEKRES